MLHKIHEHLYLASHPIELPGLRMRSTMSVLRLSGDRLVLCSPIPLDEELRRELDALGEVSAIVAPNAFHHLFLEPAIARYPKARLFGSRAVAKKRSDLRFSQLLDERLPPEWEGELSGFVVRGVESLGELVLYHPASRALLLTDLVFHFGPDQGLLGALMLRLLGVHDRLGQSKSWQWIFARSPEAKAEVAASTQPLWRWPFERLVVGHGEPILEDAQQQLRAALLPWMGASPDAQNSEK